MPGFTSLGSHLPFIMSCVHFVISCDPGVSFRLISLGPYLASLSSSGFSVAHFWTPNELTLSFSIFKFSLSQSHFSTFPEVLEFSTFIPLTGALSFITRDANDDDNVIVN